VASQQSASQAYAASPATGSTSHVAPSDELLLRRYRVMGSCGTGGFGTVLACWDTRLQRRVAIKRMRLMQSPGMPAANAYPPSSTRRSALTPGAPISVAQTQAVAATMEEALIEARTASRLTHPGIVAVHDFEVEAGIAYLVMEYVDGINLAELLSRVEGGRLTHDEAAYLVQRLGEAIAFAHRESVLHLDIKPSNIMFTRDGTVKLCDFGMATLASAAGYADARGGTVGYMPPEQVEDGMVDERTDVFGMAVVLAQSLTGVSPFAAQTAEQSCALIRRGPRPKLSKLDPDLGGMAEQTLLACLAADPAMRPPDAAAVANDLAFGLGDPDDGAQSIATLLSQLDAAVDDTEPEWEGERLPLYYRFPQLSDWICRAASAWVGGALAHTLVPHIPALSSVPPVAAALAVAVAAAIWPPTTSLVVLVLLVWTIALGAELSGGSTAILLAVGLAVAGGIWWLTQVKRRHGSLALLVAACVGEPAAASAIAAATQTPIAAGATAALAWAIARLLPAMLAAEAVRDFAAPGLPVDLDILAASFPPYQFVCLAGCALAAAAGAALTRMGEELWHDVAGQALCCVVTIFSQLLASRMENNGIWPAPRWDTVGVALTLAVIVCVAAMVRGPLDADMEDEDLK
jgi:serine/threonine-protein kinase